MERMDWGSAASRLREAMTIAPDSPAVIRAVLDFQLRTRSDPGDVVQTLKELSESGDWKNADMLSLAEAEFARGAHQTARTTLEAMPEAERTTNPAAIALEARILKLERRHTDAESRMRAALTATPPDAMSRFKLALLNIKQPHPDLQAQGRAELWNIARERGQTALLAVRVLASDALLTSAQADELLRLADSTSTEGQEARLAIITRLIRLRPADKEAILDEEARRLNGNDVASRLQFARWLAAIQEPERALELLPSEHGVNSGELPVNVLQVRLAALASLRRLDDARQLLDQPEVKEKLGMVGVHLWHARLSAAQGNAPDAVRLHLDMAFDAAIAAKDTAGSLQAAMIAEQLELHGTAAAFYQRIAQRTSSQADRRGLLEKALAIHTSARDSSAMLQVSRLLNEQTPDHEANTFLVNYLSLLLGDSIEVIAARTKDVGDDESDAITRSRMTFLRAMAAFRLRLPVQLAVLRELQATEWPAGQRAVLAALIAANGDQATAFHLAERIPTSLLLPEEMRLLTLAQ